MLEQIFLCSPQAAQKPLAGSGEIAQSVKCLPCKDEEDSSSVPRSCVKSQVCACGSSQEPQSSRLNSNQQPECSEKTILVWFFHGGNADSPRQ